MLEYDFFLQHVFSVIMTELDYVLIRENKSQRKPVLWYFLRSAGCLTGYGCLHSTVTFLFPIK